MSKRSKIIGLVLAALILGLVVVVASWSREPSYDGRTLTSWLLEYCEGRGYLAEDQSKAAAAIRAIGAERATPHLLRMVQIQDGPIRKWIMQKNEDWEISLLKMREAEMTQQFAIVGFWALGTNGAAAVPQLARLMADTNHTLIALHCLAGIGKAAETPLCQALTNRDPEVRRLATEQLQGVTDDIGVYLARLSGSLKDPDTVVRSSAVWALGTQTNHPNEVIPFLVTALQDPQQRVVQLASRFLGRLGTNSMQAFDALSVVVENGSALTAEEALKSLTLIEPDRAMPVILRWLRSVEDGRAFRAALILGGFSKPTPEVVAALKNALAGADPRTAQAATYALIALRQKSRETGTAAPVMIPGEPSYWGKSLRECLKTMAGVDRSAEDEDAIRQMGPNVIPALLQMLTYRDPEFGVYDDELCSQAIRGFHFLGKAGAPALPRLKELIAGKDERLALHALNAADKMGENREVLNALRTQSENGQSAPGVPWIDLGSRAVGNGVMK